MTVYPTLFHRLRLVNGRSPETHQPSLTRARGKVTTRRSWIVTALFLLTFIGFWEARAIVRVQPVDVSPAEVMTLAASGALATATIQNDHIVLRRSADNGSPAARVRAWFGLPADGQLLVMRGHSEADVDRVRAQLDAHGVRILGG